MEEKLREALEDAVLLLEMAHEGKLAVLSQRGVIALTSYKKLIEESKNK